MLAQKHGRQGRTGTGLPRWAARGLGTGLVLGAPVPLVVLLVAILPALRFGYPLVLVPLLAAGPLAVQGLRPLRAIQAALLAGVVSAVLAAGGLAIGARVLGDPIWSLVPAAGSPPMSALPHLALLPLTALSWPQQDILLLQPVIALALGGLALLGRSLGVLAPHLPSFIVPRSVRVRLMLANVSLIALTFLVGWVGFSALEEMHARSHQVQLHAGWQEELSDIAASLDAEVVAHAAGRDETIHVYELRRSLASLAYATEPPGSVYAGDLAEMQARYRPYLDLLRAAYTAHRARPDDVGALQATRSAINMLRHQLDEDVEDLAASDDLTRHQRLVALMAILALAVTVGVWLGHWIVETIDVPMRQLIAHMARVSRGDFSRRAPSVGLTELQSLAAAIDSMTDDLDRLYNVERTGRTAAEQRFVREQILTRAGTALVAASDRDKIFQVAVKSALSLAGQSGKVRATVAVGIVEQMRVTAALGEGAAEAIGKRLDMRRLLSGPNLELQQRRFKPLEMGVADVIAMLGFRPLLGTIIVTTLLVRRGSLTMIMLESDDALADECAEGLTKLGAEVALALDSLALNETMLVQRSEARFSSLVQNSTDVVMILGGDGAIQYQSPSGERVFGYEHTALQGIYLRDLIHPDDVVKLHAFLDAVESRAEATPRVEWRVHHADGSWIHTETVGNNLLDDPDVRGLVLNSRDISDRMALQDQLTYQAFHDPLTSLPNRALFMDRLEHAMIRADRREQAVALLFLDLDNFKIVNDSLGHQAGDQMLIAAAGRLLECVRAEDTVARLGGDEFTILIEDVRGLDSALEVAERIADQLRAPFAIRGHELFTTASIGIAVSGFDVDTSADLLRNADLAMYRAKADGKARHIVFDSAMNLQAMKRLQLESALRRAVERNELRLVFQPIMSLETMGIDRVETLVRWEHPEKGMVSPADFIPLAEETGLIVPIGMWILEEACRQAQDWKRQLPYAPEPVISVNLSPRQFLHPTLLEDIVRILEETGLPPERLELEITEGAVMEDPAAARAILQQLHDLEISLAIDDFGTGYSSLAYLKRFPVHVLKVDQSFVRGLGQDEQDSAIVRGVIALAHSLNLSVTAEGIETFEQLARLRELGCNHGQGYLLSRPIPSPALLALLAKATVHLPSPKHSFLLDRPAPPEDLMRRAAGGRRLGA
jgi:diguanylate cyclase (GGDEF)-like protein/PAS domain S-box-containing protein